MKVETVTHKIVEYLNRVDDFRTAKQICKDLNETSSRVSAALIYLYRKKAINAELSMGDIWYFNTPDEDSRMRVILEVKEDVKRPNRKAHRRSRRNPNELPKR